MSNKSTVRKKTVLPTRDYTVIKVMAALVLLIAELLVLNRVGRFMTTIGGVERLRPLLPIGILVCAVLAAASLAVILLIRSKPLYRRICCYTLAFFLLKLVTCVILRNFLADQMILLYFLHAAFYCLYIIYMLYRAEFFAVSLLNCVAGWTFYRYFPGIAWNSRIIGYGAALVVLAAVLSLLAKLLYGTHGVVTLNGKKFRLLPQNFTPTFLYVCCGLWVVCLIASLLIGALFAYYCMFAVIAVELIAAVYYTFRMK